MTVVNLMDDCQEDLQEFVINHIGMSGQESNIVCKTTYDALDEDHVNLDNRIFRSDEADEKKSLFIQTLIYKLSFKWIKMGLNELKVKILIQKFIPFVVSIIFYKLDEKCYEAEEAMVLA